MISTNTLPVGVEVQGLDLARPIESQTSAALRALLDEHQLLVFKGQDLSDEQHVKAMEVFGPTLQEQGQTHCSFVSNVRPGGVLWDVDLPFHIDYCFRTYQGILVSLYGYDVGGTSMPTGYFNSIKAVDRLPPALRAKLEGRTAVHAKLNEEKERKRVRLLDLSDPSAYRQKRRPVFRPHPRTGTTMLALYEYFTSHIDGLSSQENEELLAEVFDCIYAPEHVYLHHWRKGDLLIWDNLAVHHSRKLLEGAVRESPRTLRRVAVTDKDVSQMLPMVS